MYRRQTCSLSLLRELASGMSLLPQEPEDTWVSVVCEMQACPLFLRCVEEYRLAPDGRTCVLQSEACEGPACQRHSTRFNDTLFGEMLHGYNNKTQQVHLGQVFQMTFR